MGNVKRYELIFEVLGKQSNLILCEEDRIIGCWYRKEGGLDDRSILPGRLYFPPERKEGIFIQEVDRDFFLSALAEGGWDSFAKRVYPLPKFLLKELRSRCKSLDTPQSLVNCWEQFRKVRGELFSPYLWISKDHSNVYPFGKEGTERKDVNDALESFVRGFLAGKELEAEKKALRKVVSGRIKSLERLMGRLSSELSGLEDYERFKLWGEALLINATRLKEGMEKADVKNPYNPDELLVIPLEGKRPVQVAQECFSKYTKLKSKKEHLERRIEEVEEEKAFLEEVLWQIEEAESFDELKQIKEMLEGLGYIRSSQQVKRSFSKRPGTEPKYLTFRIDGVTVYVGKNSRANEYVTFKLAKKDDLWLHVKGYPGSHVVVRGKDLSDELLEKIASVAAYFSKVKGAKKVDVDYTVVKNVRKAKPYRPGRVFYTNYSTVTVEPKSPEEVGYVEEG